jgi:hypothetical protein
MLPTCGDLWRSEILCLTIAALMTPKATNVTLLTRVFTHGIPVALLIGCSSPQKFPAPDEDGPPSTAFFIFELSASENTFTIGALLKNTGTEPYAFTKRDAKIYFTPFDSWAVPADMDRGARSKVTITSNAHVTSWEDGESPALRIAPGQEKWIRLQGNLDAPSARKFLDAKAKYASLGLPRMLKRGSWYAASSVPFPLWYTLEESLDKYCRRIECK